MFYSHQLLARKAPLGQIWMAATMHAKIHRRKLDKLNIIKICEEILNPAVPMALRLSGILMGGVVIVYERKVKLLYDDVTRLLVEINEAWKVKTAPDPTLLPKGKSQAKYEAVTLPDNQESDLGEIEQSLTSTYRMAGFHESGYFTMRLDNVNDHYVANTAMDEDHPKQYHQADVDNITLFERFDSYQTDTIICNRFERFDNERDDEAQLNFTSQEGTQIPSILVPSPPRPEEPQKPDEILDQHPEDPVNQQSDEGKAFSQTQLDQQKKARKRARKPATFAMDYDQTIIPGHMYQSWLQSSSDIVSRRGRKRKHLDPMSTMKIGNLMELPPIVLICGLATGNGEIHYPEPLLELWMRSTQPPFDSISGRISPPPPPEPSSSSPADRAQYNDPMSFLFEDFHGGFGSQPLGQSVEKLMPDLDTNKIPNEVPMEVLENILVNNGVMVTPGNSGDEAKSLPSSGSGHDFGSHNFEINSSRSNKKRPYSSSKHGGSGLEAVAEEESWQNLDGLDPNFELAPLPENGLTPEIDLLVETGPTQTQHPISNLPIDHITEAVVMKMKTHFDISEVPRVESLNYLASGLDKKRAACLFYQTCVLATRDFIRVEQHEPYGDILISRGAKI